MVQLTEAERLAKVKYALYGDATPNYNDEQLKLYIEEVLDEMIHADVKENVAKARRLSVVSHAALMTSGILRAETSSTANITTKGWFNSS